jgi:hypothetical protein
VRFQVLTAAVRTSETSVNFNVTTLRYIPEDSKLHTMKGFGKVEVCLQEIGDESQLHAAADFYHYF